MQDISFIDKKHFKMNPPVSYKNGWIVEGRKNTQRVIWDDLFEGEHVGEQSWSSEIEEIHEEPTKDGWIDVYERKQVKRVIGNALDNKTGQLVMEFGSSMGYMIEDIKTAYPAQRYIATDIMPDGLAKSCIRNPDIYHIQCDFTSAPFCDESIDVVYGLNVLEHITDDTRAISECYRVLKKGGYCLFVVPRGQKLYDYFDEMLFHKRRYSKGELVKKVENVGFKVIKDFHLAWFCYPAFFIKKKLNRILGKRLTEEEKMKRVRDDIKNAMASPLAIMMIKIEEKIGTLLNPSYGVRELVWLKKE